MVSKKITVVMLLLCALVMGLTRYGFTEDEVDIPEGVAVGETFEVGGFTYGVIDVGDGPEALHLQYYNPAQDLDVGTPMTTAPVYGGGGVYSNPTQQAWENSGLGYSIDNPLAGMSPVDIASLPSLAAGTGASADAFSSAASVFNAQYIPNNISEVTPALVTRREEMELKIKQWEASSASYAPAIVSQYKAALGSVNDALVEWTTGWESNVSAPAGNATVPSAPPAVMESVMLGGDWERLTEAQAGALLDYSRSEYLQHDYNAGRVNLPSCFKLEFNHKDNEATVTFRPRIM